MTTRPLDHKLPLDLFDIPVKTGPFTSKPVNTLQDIADLTNDEVDNLDLTALSLLQQANIQLLLQARNGNLNAIKTLHDRLYGKPVEMTKIQTLDPVEDYSDDFSDDELMKSMGIKKPL
jgi:hypothetical protein